jgi:hypothetical protein
MRQDDIVPREHQMKWSDLLTISCMAAMVKQDLTPDMKDCVAIWRYNIINAQTTRLIRQLQDRYSTLSSPDPFEVGDDDALFLALIASDNGRGIASMLRDYAWLFGLGSKQLFLH